MRQFHAKHHANDDVLTTRSAGNCGWLTDRPCVRMKSVGFTLSFAAPAPRERIAFAAVH